MTLINKKATIRIENFNPECLNLGFKKFIENNVGRIFTVKQEKQYEGTDIYTFKEDDTYLFYENDLRLIK